MNINQTLKEKIDELISRLNVVNNEIEKIVADINYLNDETPEFLGMITVRDYLIKKIFELKNVFNI